MISLTRLSTFLAILMWCGIPAMAAEPASRPAENRPAKRQPRMQGNAGRARLPAPDQAIPPGAKVLRDMEYARVGDQSLRLDVYLPPEGPARPLPVIVWIHGGGWQSGSKNTCPLAGMCGEGYAVVSIDYRLTDVAAFPAQIHDCKAAIRWVRAQAARYGFDPKHIGAAGASAGGHLVALLGTSGQVKELEGDVGDSDSESSRVQAVCDFCGPAAFMAWESSTNGSKTQFRGHKAMDKLLGGPLRENREKARLASPVAHVSKDDPPFLIVHGDEDPLVPLDQSQRLAGALEQAGVPVILHVVKGGGHGVVLPPTARMAKEFFDRHLKK